MRGYLLTGIACATLVSILLPPLSASRADELTFTPQIMKSDASLGINATSQTDEYTTNGKKLEASGTFLREDISTEMEGFIYHPRFEIFTAKVTGYLNQWDITGNYTTNPSRSTSGDVDYNLRTVFLPEHPYNLELYALHQSASAPQSFFEFQRSSIDSEGGSIRYKEKPVNFVASYDDTSTDLGPNRTNTDIYRLSANYNTRVTSNAAQYSDSQSSSSYNVNTDRQFYSFVNTIRLFGDTLDSHYDRALTNQQSVNIQDYKTDIENWTENLNMPLFWNFNAAASYQYQDENDLTTEASSTLPPTATFDRTNTTYLNLSHRLYNSLVTNFTYNDISMVSPSGDTVTKIDTINSTYTKWIPSGRIAGSVLYSQADSDSNGTPVVINETHNTTVTPPANTFSLLQLNPIENTIVIQVLDPTTGLLVTLSPLSNYQISHLGTATQITIISVSPPLTTPQVNPNYSYEFHVSYSLQQGAQLKTYTEGYSLKADLLHRLLSPYYSYQVVRQTVTSGSIAGGSDNVIDQVAGIMSIYGPFSATVEHTSYRSQVYPYAQWKYQAAYQDHFGQGQSVTVSADLSYIVTDYYASSSSIFTSTGYQQKLEGSDLRLSKLFLENNLSFNLTGSYFITRSLTNSNSTTLNSNLTWRIGLLSVNMGAQYNRLDSLSSLGETSLMSQYYYLTLTRSLF